MIFITLGSQKFQFNRLLKAIDKLVSEGKITNTVFAQTGYSDYLPQHFEYKAFMDREEFSHMQDNADIIITHGGTGAIVGALKKGKKVIAVPRLAKYGEHVDDHQMQIVSQFSDLNFICKCVDCEDLMNCISYVSEHVFSKYFSNTGRIINNIEDFLSQI